MAPAVDFPGGPGPVHGREDRPSESGGQFDEAAVRAFTRGPDRLSGSGRRPDRDKTQVVDADDGVATSIRPRFMPVT